MSIASLMQLHHIASGEVQEIHDGFGARVIVVRGAAWLTQQGDEDDHVLGTGDSFTIDRAGQVLASALGAGDAVLRIVAATDLPMVA
jgi:hypothetical protein